MEFRKDEATATQTVEQVRSGQVRQVANRTGKQQLFYLSGIMSGLHNLSLLLSL